MNTIDPTESARRELTAEINAAKAQREQMEQEYGKVWSTSELSQDFEVKGFMAPLVVVKRKSDGVKGTLMFQHNPRLYFGFEEAD
jgi:hypothetical protein